LPYTTFFRSQYGKPEIANHANPMGWTSFMSLRDAMQVIDREDTDRYGASLAADYAIMSGLNLRLTAGLDVFNETRAQFYPFDWSVSGTTTRNPDGLDRKSTRLNSSHVKISYAV